MSPWSEQLRKKNSCDNFDKKICLRAASASASLEPWSLTDHDVVEKKDILFWEKSTSFTPAKFFLFQGAKIYGTQFMLTIVECYAISATAARRCYGSTIRTHF